MLFIIWHPQTHITCCPSNIPYLFLSHSSAPLSLYLSLSISFLHAFWHTPVRILRATPWLNVVTDNRRTTMGRGAKHLCTHLCRDSHTHTPAHTRIQLTWTTSTPFTVHWIFLINTHNLYTFIRNIYNVNSHTHSQAHTQNVHPSQSWVRDLPHSASMSWQRSWQQGKGGTGRGS